MFAGPDAAARRDSLLDAVLGTGGTATIVGRNAPVQHWLGRQLALRGERRTTVLSWQAWLDSLWLAVGDGRTIIDASVRAALIVETLADMELAPARRGALELGGGRRLLGEVLEEIGGEELAVADGAYAHYASAIDRYRELAASHGYIERAEAVEAIAAQTAPLESAIAFVGFSDLTTRETDLLVSLAARGEVAVELALGEERTGQLAGNAAAVRQFETVGLEIVHARPDRLARPSALVAARWGAADAKVLGGLLGSGTVTYGLAEGTPSEVVLVVDRVVEELAAGTKPDEVAVIFRKSQTMAPLVAAEMERRSIPHVVVESVPFSATGLGAAFTALLAAAASAKANPSLPGAPLLGAFLTSAYAGLDRERAVRLDAKARQRRLGVGEIFASARWYRPAGDGSTSDTAAGEGRVELTAVGRAAVAAESDGTPDCAIALKITADMIAANARAAGVSTWWAERQDAAAHRAITDTIASLEDAGLTPTVATVLQALASATVMVSARPNTRGRVTVAGATKVSGRTFEAVVLGGLADADYAVQLEQTPAQRVREGLGLQGNPSAEESEELIGSELLSTARERLHLVWRSHDHTGEELVQSPLLRQILAVVGEPADVEANLPREGAVARRRLSDAEVVASRSHARAERVGEYRNPTDAAPPALGRGEVPIVIPPSFWEGRDLSPSQIEAYHRCPYGWFLTRFLRPAELDPSFGAREEGTLVHRILERFYRRWVRELGRGALSPDLLAQARPVFDVIADEEVQAALAAMDAAAEDGAAAEPDDGADGAGDGGAEGATDESSDGVAEGESAELSGSWVLRGIEIALIRDSAWSRLVKDASAPYDTTSRAKAARYPEEMQPAYFEWKFGSQALRDTENQDGAVSDPDRYLDPVVVAGVSLTGSIDRIDTALVKNEVTGAVEHLLAVVDYKGSLESYPASGGLIEKGYIQAPLYLLAAEQALGGEGIYAGYSSYSPPKNKVIGVADGRVVKATWATAERDQAFRETLDGVEALVGDVAERMAGGEIPSQTAESLLQTAPCSYCAHTGCANRTEGW